MKTKKTKKYNMNPKLFKQINELLARLIYAPDTTKAMREAAKDARRSLHRLFGKDSKLVLRRIGRRAQAGNQTNQAV